MTFSELRKINVNDHTEARDGLTYLSWAWAWDEFKQSYPDATYTVWKDEQGRPYVFDENLGYMVFVSVTAGGITHEMWLPVMDSSNRAMKAEPYEVQTKTKTFTVKPATMFDVNKTIMRCLTKCIAMFGLGLYIYAGEDLPEAEPITCAVCGNPITDGKRTNGSVWKASDIAEYTKRRFGASMCQKCGEQKAKEG